MRLISPLGLHPATRPAPTQVAAPPVRWRAVRSATAGAGGQAMAQTTTTAKPNGPGARRWLGAAAMLLLHLGGLLGAWLWPVEQAGTQAAPNTATHPVVMLWRPASPAQREAAAPSSQSAPAPVVAPTPPVQAAVVAPPMPPLPTPPMSSVSGVQAGAAAEVPAVASTAAAAPAVATATDPITPTAAPPAAPAVVHARADHQRCPRPSHPPALRERGIEGLVQLRVLVDSQGQASQVQLLASSGWRLFDEAALAMARGCRFHPARQADRAVDSWVEFPVRFALQG